MIDFPETLPLDRLVFGGSFDPPHRGHLALLRHVLENNITRAVDIIPAHLSPFKKNRPPLPAAERLHMLELALGDGELSGVRERMRILDLEIRRKPPSFTIDTCRELLRQNRSSRLGLLIGSDSLRGMADWKEPQNLFRLVPIIVFRRAGIAEKRVLGWIEDLIGRFPEYPPRFLILDNPTNPCSSTGIRQALAGKINGDRGTEGERGIEGEREGDFPADRLKILEKCMTGELLAYILQNNLYRHT